MSDLFVTAMQENLPQPADLKQLIERQIVERTGGRIQELAVAVSGDRVLIRGRAATFHLKQLAIQGVIDAIGSCVASQLQLEVQVSVTLSKSDAEAV
jgi:hypothetical protein